MIDFINVSKSYATQDLMIDVSFRINQQERVGIVGPNGAGKSTIFGMITGEIEPDRGDINFPKSSQIGYLHQHLITATPDEPLLQYTTSGVQNLDKIAAEIKKLEAKFEKDHSETDLKKLGELQTRFESLGGYTIKHRAESALTGLGFKVEDFNKPFKTFSGGWQMRSALARILISNPDILLLDEPSNYLDIPAIEWMDRFLRNFQGTLLLISHDRHLLKNLTNITLEVNGGDVIRYPGDYDYYARERENRAMHLEAAKKNQDKKREQMERFVERFRAKSTKATAVKSQIKKIEKLEDIRLPDQLHFTGTIMIPDPPHCGSEVARLENASFSYDSKRWIVQDVDLSVNRGDKIAFVGFNGLGKTTLMKMLIGNLPLNSGKQVLGHKVIIGYQAQEFAEVLPPEKSVYDVMKRALPASRSENDLRGIMGAFGFSGEAVHKQCQVLSGGEKIRLCFARVFINPPNLLILDEPTTHLDIAAREALQKAIADYKGTVCLVSHDIQFIKNTAETIVEMTPPGITKYHGNYDYYLAKSKHFEQEEEEEVVETAKSNPKLLRKERTEKRQVMIEQKRSLEKLVKNSEKTIAASEEEKEGITAQLLSGEPDIDFAALNKRMKELNDLIENSTNTWEESAMELEELLEVYNAI